MLLLERGCLQGDSNTAVSLEKEKAREIGVISEWGTKGQGMLDQGRGVVITP